MTNQEWRLFFQTAHRILGSGEQESWASDSWCAWTTFSSLASLINYWTSGMPNEADLGEIGTCDGGTWGQPFLYSDLAHVIVPATFQWERMDSTGFQCGTKTQDIEALSAELTKLGLAHRKTERMLEIKLY